MIEHTNGQRTADNPTGKCPCCPGEHGGPGPCDQRRDSRRRRQFDLVPWHLEERLAALLNPDQRAASAVMARQDEEFASRPSGHLCWCVCPNIAHGRRECDECRRRHANEVPQVTIEIGRTAAVHAPSPSASTLDLLMGKL